MAEFTAKDVQALRQATGAGMMDAKKALVENDGDPEAAAQWLREKGLAKVGQARRPREQPGRGRRRRRRQRRRHRELKCETDFSAKADDFVVAGAGPRRRWSWPRAPTPSPSWPTRSTT